MKKLKKWALLGALSLFASACGIYKGSFQCPPGKGVGCVSTSDVLDMIIEEDSNSEDPFDDGKNHFVRDPRSCR
ncbi:hypothetical protein [Candidatus Neptunochlamydia vexilliferae]|uniref:Lipoprotein n=1 Tax=Candidatus Neptunichlamydia vexilliferae TaxID=1651774 RepID=A0ABS0AY43_9BACT|nr:hypothetical protein [Candidatus Neptunochlamydia vexilliferae]MBF5059057.1 hypothetical protein [Candidatus Neptunochlamydia vexilliferae]